MIYNRANKVFEHASTIEDYRKAYNIFDSLGDYKDVTEKKTLCQNKITEIEEQEREKEEQWEQEMCRKNVKRISEELNKIKNNLEHSGNNIESLDGWERLSDRASKEWSNLYSIYGESCKIWNAEEFIEECKKKISQIRHEMYKYGLQLKTEKKWREAAEIFGQLCDYKDSEDLLSQCESQQIEEERIAREEERKAREEKKRKEEEFRIREKEKIMNKRLQLEEQQRQLRNELSNLKGLFSGKKRKELELTLLQIENELQNIKQ